MGTINGNQFKSSYLGDQIDALLAAMAQANPLPSGTDWVAFIDDCRDAQSEAESAAVSSEEAAAAASGYADNAAVKATEAAGSALSAAGSASSAASRATLSQSWAVGGTGTRTGENTNNAKYWAEQASHAAGGGVYSFNNRAGYVTPQSEDYASFYTSVVGKGINLLDNWYFIGGGSQQGGGQLPINQRGQTSYSGVGYGIDRWYNNGAQTSTEITANGLRVYRTQGSSSTGTKNAVQYVSGLERFIGQQVTISALVNSSTNFASVMAFNGVVSGSTALGSSSAENVQNPTLISKTITLPNNFTGTLAFVLRSAGGDYEATFAAAKLELGDTQTLARNVGTVANPQWVLNDPLPDFATELMKCQWYLQTVRKIPGVGIASSDSVLVLPIQFMGVMRASPTVIQGTALAYARNTQGGSSEVALTYNSAGFNSNDSCNLIFTAAENSFTAGSPYYVLFGGNNRMLLSAEL